ncbi:MAG: glycosyltransferase family 39 protein, partial [Anaerolineales bacterium]|nr:glycosyltransferase family 39 protein [Anaerolineales bacterium]
MIISSREIYWFILTLLAVGGSVLIWKVTHQGIGLGSDSAVYISAGKNLVAGRGLTWITGGGEMHPVTHFPPLFPLVLSGFEFIGVDPIAGARLLNSFLFGVNILLVAGMVNLATGSQWFSVFGAFLISISIFMIRAHSWVMTEPLYLMLGFGGLIILAIYIKNRQRTWLVLAGTAIGLAYLTRYAGISLVVVGITGLICAYGETWRRRLVDAIIFMAVSLTLNLLWMLRNEYLTGYSTSRSLRLYFPAVEELFTVAKVVLGWFFPAGLLDRLPDGFLLLGFTGLVLLMGLIIVSWIWNLLPNKNTKTMKPFQPWMGSLLAFHAVAFLGMMALSSILIYPPPALDFRLFLPLYLTVIVMIVWGLSVAWNSRNLILRSGVVLVIGLFTVSSIIRSQAVISELLQNGQGYSGS